MLFDSSIILANYIAIIVNNNTRSQFNNYSSDNNDREFSSTSIQIRYNRRELNMLKTEVFFVYEFYKKILQNYRVKKYIREIIKTIQKMNKIYDQKYNKKTLLLQLFIVIKKNNASLKYKKNKSRRRVLIGREIAN